MVVKYLHYVVPGSKGLCVVVEVLCKVGGAAAMVKSTLVFFVASAELLGGRFCGVIGNELLCRMPQGLCGPDWRTVVTPRHSDHYRRTI